MHAGLLEHNDAALKYSPVKAFLHTPASHPCSCPLETVVGITHLLAGMAGNPWSAVPASAHSKSQESTILKDAVSCVMC